MDLCFLQTRTNYQADEVDVSMLQCLYQFILGSMTDTDLYFILNMYLVSDYFQEEERVFCTLSLLPAMSYEFVCLVEGLINLCYLQWLDHLENANFAQVLLKMKLTITASYLSFIEVTCSLNQI